MEWGTVSEAIALPSQPQRMLLKDAIRLAKIKYGYTDAPRDTNTPTPPKVSKEDREARHRKYTNEYYHTIRKTDPVEHARILERGRARYKERKENDPVWYQALLDRHCRNRRKRGIPPKVALPEEELRERKRTRWLRYYRSHKSDSVWREQRNERARARRKYIKENDPERYQALLKNERERRQKSLAKTGASQ